MIKVSFSHKKFGSFIKQWECVHFAALPSIEDIEEACQAFKEGPLKDYIDSFRKFADFWDGMNNYDHYGWKMFGQHPNEEDLIFRKLTGIDEFFDRGKII